LKHCKTIIYVDGYNLYYSALRKSTHKWLDLHELLFNKIIKPVVPESNIVQIKFFTSPILGRYASDKESPARQKTYHNALIAQHPNLVTIINGFHSHTEKNAYHADLSNGTDRLLVKVMEEKQTDVNISLHMYRDAVNFDAEHIVLVSNDSDLSPAIKMIREDFEAIKIGVIIPALQHKNGARKSGKLKSLAHWVREYIREDELEQSQLPKAIQNRKNKTIRKPEAWSANSAR